MARALTERGVAFVEIDVDADPAIEERYGERVPVLVRADGSEICHYFLDDAALSSTLHDSARARADQGSRCQ